MKSKINKTELMAKNNEMDTLRESLITKIQERTHKSKQDILSIIDITLTIDASFRLKLFDDVFPLEIFHLPDVQDDVILMITMENKTADKSLTFSTPISELIDEVVNVLTDESYTNEIKGLIDSFNAIDWNKPEFKWAQEYKAMTTNLIRENLFPESIIEDMMAYKLFSAKFLKQMADKLEININCDIEHFYFKDNTYTFVTASKVAFIIKKNKKDIELVDVKSLTSINILQNELLFLNSDEYGNTDINNWVDLRPYLEVK